MDDEREQTTEQGYRGSAEQEAYEQGAGGGDQDAEPTLTEEQVDRDSERDQAEGASDQASG